jgi:phage-related protein (TIGR01555 family)
MRFLDGFVNVLARLGAGDKASHGTYTFAGKSHAQLLDAYRSAALARRIVDLPAEDACREWRDWQAEADQIGKIEAEEQRLGLHVKVLDAQRRARLFGGAAIYIGVGDQNPSLPLDMERVRRIEHLTVVNKIDLSVDEIEDDALSPYYGQPRLWRLRSAFVHPSRLAVFHGVHVPYDMHVGDGWGDSALESVLSNVTNMDTAAAAIVSLIIEAKIDVFGIPGFAQGLATGGVAYENSVVNRLRLMNMAKGINAAIVKDAEETYDQKSASFGGLPEITDRLMALCSAAAGIPQTLLFGQSPGGLNATGESDIRGYYDRVRVHQTMNMTPAMHTLDECLIRAALGGRPEEIHYVWRPLWQPSVKERAEVGKLIADTFSAVHAMGVVSPEAIGAAIVNALTEAGAAPGLESAVDEFPAEEDDEDDMIAAATIAPPEEI